MSSAYVRNLVRSWMPSLSTPFVETINEEQNPDVPLWVTVQFDQTGRERITFCEQYTETGTITLSWLGRPGVGDAEVIAAAEQDAATFMGMTDPAARLVVTNRSAPDDFEGQGVPAFQVDITFDYSYLS